MTAERRGGSIKGEGWKRDSRVEKGFAWGRGGKDRGNTPGDGEGGEPRTRDLEDLYWGLF